MLLAPATTNCMVPNCRPRGQGRGRGRGVVVATALPMLLAASPGTCPAQSGLAGAMPQVAVSAPALRLGLDDRVNLVYERRLQSGVGQPVDLLAHPPRTSLGMEFRTPNGSQGPRSILRVQLSGDSVLNFRPRGGGMTVIYRSQF